MKFKERAAKAMEELAKQKPTTLEQAKAQAQRVQERIEGKIKKQVPQIKKPSD